MTNSGYTGCGIIKQRMGTENPQLCQMYMSIKQWDSTVNGNDQNIYFEHQLMTLLTEQKSGCISGTVKSVVAGTETANNFFTRSMLEYASAILCYVYLIC